MVDLTKIDRVFAETMSEFEASRAMSVLLGGGLNIDHYKSVLREIYHYAKEDPQIQALATVYFRGEDRATVKMFFKHATSEIGHDQLALEDLRSLGEDPAMVPYSFPLPATMALTAYPFYQINYLNPIGYLGYLYFLEFMPTHAGQRYAEALLAAGIPPNALGFLQEHMTVDVAHNKLMEEYLQRLVRTDSDLSAVAYAIRVTGRLYADMLMGAIRQADQPVDYGLNPMELARAIRSAPAPVGAT